MSSSNAVGRAGVSGVAAVTLVSLAAMLAGCGGPDSVRAVGGDEGAAEAPPLAADAGEDADETPDDDTQARQIEAVRRWLEGDAFYEMHNTPSARAMRASRDEGDEEPAPDAEVASEADAEPEPSDPPERRTADAEGDGAESEATSIDHAEELVAALAAEAAASDDPMREARRLVMLAALAPDAVDEWLSHRATRLLSPAELERARALRRLAGDVADQSGRGLADAALTAAEAIEGQHGLRITRAVLCTSARGFGQFTPMNSNRFLAGEPKRTVLYLEAAAFLQRGVTLETGGAGFEIDLARELRLYHDADGLLAWRRPSEAVRHQTQTRLRDFFMTERIELPRSLSVGRYKLKVTLRDHATGAIAERVLPVEVVADRSLTTALNK